MVPMILRKKRKRDDGDYGKIDDGKTRGEEKGEERREEDSSGGKREEERSRRSG